MVLAFLGISILVFFTYMAKLNPQMQGSARIGRLVGAFLVVAGIATSCLIQIEAGEVGVRTLFGKVQDGILNSGLNVVNPVMEVSRFDVRTQNYTMSGMLDESQRMGDDAIRVLSADGLEVEVDLTILFRLLGDKAPEVLRTIGMDYRDKIVRPVARTKIRDFAANYDAVSLYSAKREEFQQRLSKAIEEEFGKRGIVLEQVLIRNIGLPQSVKTAIEAKINAEQESQKMRFVLEKEKQEAERKRVEAEGIADYQRILTSSLNDRLLQYEQIKAQKELAASPNSKIVIMNGKGAPLIIGQ